MSSMSTKNAFASSELVSLLRKMLKQEPSYTTLVWGLTSLIIHHLISLELGGDGSDVIM